MAHDAFDPRKRLISKHFRRMLEMYDRQAFLGPPENARETVMAATKALQRGDWSECARHILSLSIWEKMINKEHIQEMLLQKIKAEAMRTYIFTVRQNCSLLHSARAPKDLLRHWKGEMCDLLANSHFLCLFGVSVFSVLATL